MDADNNDKSKPKSANGLIKVHVLLLDGDTHFVEIEVRYLIHNSVLAKL